MSDYEKLASTKMLASHCLICGRPLLDAVSVELGMGPICRKDNAGGIPDEIRHESNILIQDAALAAQRGQISIVVSCASKIEGLGLSRLAGKIRSRFKLASLRKPDVIIKEAGEFYMVKTPYRRKGSKEFVKAWRSIPYRSWVDGQNKIPKSQKKQLWSLLQKFFGGKYGKGPKGMFRIPKLIPQMELKLS